MRISQLFSTSVLLLPLLTPVALAALETKPWTLFDITLWTADKSTPGASYIDILFQDQSKGHKVDTECSRAAIPGNKHVGINDPENFYPCANTDVSYKYNKGRIEIRRKYTTQQGGTPTTIIAFGNATITFKTEKESCGSVGTQDELKVPITSMSG